MGSGVIKLYRGGRYAKFLKKAIYCDMEDLRNVIDIWSKDYDSIFSMCYYQIKPSVELSDERLKQVKEPSKRKYRHHLVYREYDEKVVSELSLVEKVRAAILNEIKKESNKTEGRKKYAKGVNRRVRNIIVKDEPTQTPIIRPPSIYSNKTPFGIANNL